MLFSSRTRWSPGDPYILYVQKRIFTLAFKTAELKTRTIARRQRPKRCSRGYSRYQSRWYFRYTFVYWRTAINHDGISIILFVNRYGYKFHTPSRIFSQTHFRLISTGCLNRNHNESGIVIPNEWRRVATVGRNYTILLCKKSTIYRHSAIVWAEIEEDLRRLCPCKHSNNSPRNRNPYFNNEIHARFSDLARRTRKISMDFHLRLR